jgi:DNA/RNA-binding domain of Phe-tRNA-synthetase-like protein
MLTLKVDQQITDSIPQFKMGWILYNDITVSETPQLLKGRFHFFYQEEALSLETKNVSDLPGVNEWRSIFKKFGTDPSRYRPSQESLIRRLKKGQPIPEINSAVDLNNFFSIRHQVPMGLYDLANLNGTEIVIRVGTEADQYEGINGRTTVMADKLLSADALGAFGSPIVDSERTKVTGETKNGLHIIYFQPSTSIEEAESLLSQLTDQFLQVHGGTASAHLLK